MQVPDNLEERLERLESKAEEKLPGNFLISANFFRDGDMHLVAEHNCTENYSVMLHEGADEVHHSGNIVFGGVKVPFRLENP